MSKKVIDPPTPDVPATRTARRRAISVLPETLKEILDRESEVDEMLEQIISRSSDIIAQVSKKA